MIWLRRLLLLPIAGALVGHSLYFRFVSDDAYISFVYARNFAEHNQLVFNLGDRVEGYTNFLWTLLLGLLMKLGAPPEATSQILGAAFGCATFLVVARLCARLASDRRPSLWDLLPAALLAASSGYACWCSGGLETQMFTFLFMLGVLCYFEGNLARAGLAFALAAMTRPEGALLFVVLALHRLASNVFLERRLWPRRAELMACAAFLALYAPYFAWRWWYYGWPFPNTFYVKTGGPENPRMAREILGHGAFYAWQWATQSKALWVAPLAIVAMIRHRGFGSFALLTIVVFLGYTIKVGGDFMGLHRFVMPLFVLVALLASIGLRQVADWLPVRYAGAALATVVLAVFVYSQAALSQASMIPKADHGIDRPGYLKLYAHDRGLIGKALAAHILPEDFSIVGGAGVQPYYARMRAIDVFGLVSEPIAHDVPPSRARPGHQKWAPPSLLLTYAPTFLFHCYDLHRTPSEFQLCGDAASFRAKGYEPVTMHVPGLREDGEYYTFLKRKDRAWP